MPEHIAQVLNVEPIVVDLAAIRQARADRAMERDPIEIVDFSSKLESLKEYAVLSAFARRKKHYS
ncbi:MAG: hypothetical protein JNM81_01880 [Rhodospirillaceae bacterium]|nr:hypothetical protein [Rhodospirillaceae bacterium]